MINQSPRFVLAQATIPDPILRKGYSPENKALITFLLMKGFQKSKGPVRIYLHNRYAIQWNGKECLKNNKDNHWEIDRSVDGITPGFKDQLTWE